MMMGVMTGFRFSYSFPSSIDGYILNDDKMTGIMINIIDVHLSKML